MRTFELGDNLVAGVTQMRPEGPLAVTRDQLEDGNTIGRLCQAGPCAQVCERRGSDNQEAGDRACADQNLLSALKEAGIEPARFVMVACVDDAVRLAGEIYDEGARLHPDGYFAGVKSNAFFFRPGINYYQGKEGLRQIFSDMLATGETLYLLRTPEDIRFYDYEFFAELRKKRVLMGVKTIGITPDVPEANHDPEVDFKNKFIRTWLPASDYTANVEWNVSGNKVALISYGKEAIGVMIESAQIAESFRQILQLIAKQRQAQPAPRRS